MEILGEGAIVHHIGSTAIPGIAAKPVVDLMSVVADFKLVDEAFIGFEAAMKAAETVDACVKRLLDVALAHDYGGLIIADHGNADHELNDDDSPNTQHSVNMVPCIYFSKHAEGKELKNGKLADVAPTLLAILGMKKSADMTGENLIVG